jgi:hypothetical protein
MQRPSPIFGAVAAMAMAQALGLIPPTRRLERTVTLDPRVRCGPSILHQARARMTKRQLKAHMKRTIAILEEAIVNGGHIVANDGTIQYFYSMKKLRNNHRKMVEGLALLNAAPKRTATLLVNAWAPRD